MSFVVSFTALLLHAALVFAAAPCVAGLLRWIEARLAGRPGPPVRQPWIDLARLLRKRPVLAENVSPIFRLAPIGCLAATSTAAVLVPSFTLGMASAPLADLLAIAGFLALARGILALAALDAGTGPAGLAAGQAMAVATMAEPALLLVIFTLALLAGSLNVDLVAGLQLEGMLQPSTASTLTAAALTGLAFADAADPPVPLDLEFGGADLALVQAARALRLVVWLNLIGALFLPIGMAQPEVGPVGWMVGLAAWLVRLVVFTIVLALLRTTTGRLPWRSMPALLGMAALLAMLAAMVVLANAGAA